MDKLIITVTCDSKMSFPGNPHCPEPSDTKAVADEYIRAVNAGGGYRSHARFLHQRPRRYSPTAGSCKSPWSKAGTTSSEGSGQPLIPSFSLGWPACVWNRSSSCGRILAPT